jgi:hypothetical protein
MKYDSAIRSQDLIQRTVEEFRKTTTGVLSLVPNLRNKNDDRSLWMMCKTCGSEGEGGEENELVNLIFFQVAEGIGDIGDGR